MVRIFLLAAALLILLGAPARAESVRLRSGKTLQVDAVRILADRINVTMHRDGGTARVDLRFALLDPRGLLALFDRHSDPKDAAWRLRSARLALRRGLRAEAAKRFHEAARLDAQLASERDAGLAQIRALEAAEGLVELESRLRAGADPHGVMALAAALLDGPSGAALSAGQRTRIGALGRLARRLFKRDQQRAARQLLAARASAKPAAAAPAPPAAPGGAFGELLARVRGLEAKADLAREAAADPKQSSTRALGQLETAADALQRARNLLRSAPAALQEKLTERRAALRAALAATYLDLADVYRLAGRYAEARARVRAVLILDPGNEHAWAQRKLIEDDLRRDPVFGDDDGGRGFELYYGSPSPFFRTVGYPIYRYPWLGHPYGRHGGGFHLRVGYGHLRLRLGASHGHRTHHRHGGRRR